MKTKEDSVVPADADAQEQADAQAVLDHAFRGVPLDPEVACRVHERAAKVTEAVYRRHGEFDPETVNALFRDDDKA